MKTSTSLTQPATDVCDSVDAEHSFNTTLKVLGDFWVLRILGALEPSPQRFCELERALKNSNPVTLTKKLKLLEENDYIVRHTETADKQSVCYTLTQKGVATLPIIKAVKAFSADYS